MGSSSDIHTPDHGKIEHQRSNIKNLQSFGGSVSCMDFNTFLKNVPMFSSLNDKEIQYMLTKGTIKDVKKGEIIHTPEDICYCITLVLEGALYSTKYSLSGKEQIYCSFKPGDIFGFPVVFGDLTYPEYIVAETDCSLFYLHREALIELFDNKEFLLKFIEKLSHKIKAFSELVEVLSYTSVKERVVKYLLKIAEEQQSQVLKLDKNKTRLAKELGSVRVVVSRTFKNLEENGIIRQLSENKIEILDMDVLKNFS